ncbi:hypothetical protein T01_11688 [Trichinella spiralis]|uniref:Uncharacterized protein n=1 Tax=Trichinella spiralis TaxID=6334 RepID=A0A0V1AJ99_TRISP|nr:hypothetical protein T01_11688 [Trichinella spiralis]
MKLSEISSGCLKNVEIQLKSRRKMFKLRNAEE